MECSNTIGSGLDTGESDEVSSSSTISQDVDQDDIENCATDTDKEEITNESMNSFQDTNKSLYNLSHDIYDSGIKQQDQNGDVDTDDADNMNVDEDNEIKVEEHEIKLEEDEIKLEPGINNNDLDKKKKPLLAFDAYGNLTVVDETTLKQESEDPFDSVVPNDFARNEKDQPKKRPKLKMPGQDKIQNNGSHKRRTKSSESGLQEVNISDKDLKQAFKDEISTGATSRYGRARKRKTEDGFLFGVLNFNELRKITGNSPKKAKCVDDGTEIPQVKSEHSETEESTEESERIPEVSTANDSSENMADDSDFVETNNSVNKTPRKKKYVKKATPKKIKQEDEEEMEIFKPVTTPKKKKTPTPKKNIKKSPISERKSTRNENQDRRSNPRRQTKSYKELSTSDITDENSAETKQDSDYMTSDEKPTTPVEQTNTKRRTSQRFETNEGKTEEVKSPTTTKSGRQPKKFVPIDIKAVEEEQKEARKKQKENEPSSPNKNKIASPIANNKISLKDKESAIEYSVGDIVWVVMRGNPMWPALVCLDKEEQFTRSFKSSLQYHVQFCNDNHLTSWIHSTSLLPYKGYQNLREVLEEYKTTAVKTNKKLLQKPDLKMKTLTFIQKETGAKFDKWNTAVKVADTLASISSDERISKINEDVEIEQVDIPDVEVEEETEKEDIKPEEINNTTEEKDTETRTKKRGRPSKPIEEEKPIKKELKTELVDDFSGFDKQAISSCNERNLNVLMEYTKGSFEVYFEKHRDVLAEEEGLLDEDIIRDKLSSKWRKMTSAQRARYKPSSIKRKHSPSPDTETSSLDSVATSTSSNKRRRSKLVDEDERGTYRLIRNEKICYICEKLCIQSQQDIIKCKGICHGYYHYTCLGLEDIPSKDFKCDTCVNNTHPCFICKETEGDLIKCTSFHCGKFYHDNCVRKWPQVYKQRQEKFVCPRHICHMCAANTDDMTDNMARTGPFTRCLRCPTTYHTGEDCMAAGAECLTVSNHVCTKHLKTTKSSNLHVNVNWCFCCSKGGSLILCDQCPAAFHADCMHIEATDGGYVCEDCENGKYPTYGEVVWVKLGNYRWWPSQVLHPRFIPDNIEKLNHQQGMFCVRFLGSNEYYWVTRGRSFQYHDGDQGAKAAYSTKTLEKRFAQALEEAVELYHTQRTKRDKCDAERSEKSNLKPPPFVKIDTNRPVGSVKLGKLDLASVNKCDCDPYSENPCSDDEKCINRMLMFECIREVCPAGDRCCNQRFQRRQYPRVSYSKTEGRGWGLKTLDDIKKGQFVIEYVGELVDEDEFRRRLKEMHEVKEENYYFLTIDSTLMIDAGPKGNLARFMNHSCKPNCETQKWTVGADTRVGLFALEDIPAGSEVTFNYNLECVGTEKKICQCGAPNCSGFIGAKVKTEKYKPVKIKNAKKRKKRPKKDTEDECFRCGADGDLILCDMSNCPKGYHLDCLGLDKPPKGKWFCPWHHCDICGLKSTSLCDFCPNSYCRNHATGNLQIINGFGNICMEHNGDDIEAFRGQTIMTAMDQCQVNPQTESQMETETLQDTNNQKNSQDTPKALEMEPPRAVLRNCNSASGNAKTRRLSGRLRNEKENVLTFL